jgi:hypothetical protein
MRRSSEDSGEIFRKIFPKIFRGIRRGFPDFSPGMLKSRFAILPVPYFVPYEVLHLPESRNVGYVPSHLC